MLVWAFLIVIGALGVVGLAGGVAGLARAWPRGGTVALISGVSSGVLGFAGTIVGLISAFRGLGVVNAEDKQRVLSEGISHAMNATALGLVVGTVCVVLGALANRPTAGKRRAPG